MKKIFFAVIAVIVILGRRTYALSYNGLAGSKAAVENLQRHDVEYHAAEECELIPESRQHGKKCYHEA